MKKALFLAFTVAIFTTIGVHRRGRFTALTVENHRLLLEFSGDSPTGTGRESERSGEDATAANVEFIREAMVEVMLAAKDRAGGRDPEMAERTKRLLLAAQECSAREVERVMTALLTDTGLDGMEPREILRGGAQLFGDTAPFSWRAYLSAHRELPDWQENFETACRSCLRADGKRALALIEEETARGNPESSTSGVRSALLLELAVNDPDRMLALAVSTEFAADPDALAHLGGFVDDRFKGPADHQRFLAALRRAQEKNPSPVLAKIRDDYTREMSGQFYSWPAADAFAVIDTEFSADERFQVAEQSASRADLGEPGQWIDWFLKMDPEEWAAWNARKGTRFPHPLVRQIESRSIRDSELPAAWLRRIPAGPLRDEATLGYAWNIATREPDRAATYLAELPDSDGKRNLVEKIEEVRER